MHMIVAALAALLAQATPLPSPAPGAPAPAASAAPAVQHPATQPLPAPADFGELISSLNNMRSEIAKLQAMNGTSANNVKPVNVAQLSGSNPSALSSAITRNQTQLNQLRSTLGRVTITTPTNQRITVAQFLADNRMTLTQIVGVDVKNGTMLLFYQKP
jgi:hypothetical protein